MPSFSTEVSHGLGKETAVERLKGFLDRVRERYQNQVSDLEESWEQDVLNFAFKTYGFNIAGNVAVEEDKVCLDGNLPFAAVAFKGKIEQSIQDELSKALS